MSKQKLALNAFIINIETWEINIFSTNISKVYKTIFNEVIMVHF